MVVIKKNVKLIIFRFGEYLKERQGKFDFSFN